jgi:Transposase domain (DUF772)
MAQAIQTIAVKLAAAPSSVHRSCHSAFSGQSVSIEVKIMTLIFCGTNRLSLVPFLLETVLPHPLDTPVMDKHSVPGLSARYEKLQQKQDLLVRLNQVIPWETFRPQLSQIHEKVRKSAAGRKPTDVVVRFKMLVLQQLHNISDESLVSVMNYSR